MEKQEETTHEHTNQSYNHSGFTDRML